MKIELLIHGHGAAQHVFDMCAPLWARHGYPMTVFCSNNDPLSTKLPVEIFGQSGPSGVQAYARWINFLRWMVQREADHYFIFEYDSFCLSKELQIQSGLTGCMTSNMEGACWVAHQYPGHPMSVDIKSAAKMLSVSKEYPDLTEMGFVDRLYAALATLSNVPMRPWRPLGFCRNTIAPSDTQDLVGAIERGARMIHGIKSKDMFDVCLSTMKAIGQPINDA